MQEGGEGCSPGAAEAQPVLSSGAPQAEAWVDTGSMQGWSSPGARMGANPPGVQLDKTIDRSRHHWLPLTSFTVWTSPHSDGTCGQGLPNFQWHRPRRRWGSSNFRIYETPQGVLLGCKVQDPGARSPILGVPNVTWTMLTRVCWGWHQLADNPVQGCH